MLEFVHGLANLLGDVEGVCTGELKNRETGRWLAVQQRIHIVILGPKFHPRHVPEPSQTAIFGRFDDNLLKLLYITQTTESGDCVLKSLTGRCRGLADLTGGHLHILFANRVDHILRRQLTCFELTRL